MLEYMELLDAERLTDARAVDRHYHAAKLQAWAFHEPENIHKEHAEVRADFLTPAASVSPMTPDHWARVGSIVRRLEREGILPGVN